MTRERFEKQLRVVKTDMLSTGEKAKELVRLSVKALKEKDIGLAEQVIEADREIDAEYVKLEERIMRVIAMQAPVASDLRLLLTALKNATDIERLGDYAKDIAEITISLQDEPYFTQLIIIPQMADEALEMVEMSLRSFDSEDLSVAREVYKHDDVVDEMFSRVFRTMASYVAENPKHTKQAFNLMLVARHLERIADHAQNISNRTIYLKEGKITYI